MATIQKLNSNGYLQSSGTGPCSSKTKPSPLKNWLLTGFVGQASMMLIIATSIKEDLPSMVIVSDVAFGIVILNDLIKVMQLIKSDAEESGGILSADKLLPFKNNKAGDSSGSTAFLLAGLRISNIL